MASEQEKVSAEAAIMGLNAQVREMHHKYGRVLAEKRAPILEDRFLPSWEKERQVHHVQAELQETFTGAAAEALEQADEIVEHARRAYDKAATAALRQGGVVENPGRVQTLAEDMKAQLAAAGSADERVGLIGRFAEAARGDGEWTRAVRIAGLPYLDTKTQRLEGTTGNSARRLASDLKAVHTPSPEEVAAARDLEAAEQAREMLKGHRAELLERLNRSGGAGRQRGASVFDSHDYRDKN